MKCIILHKIKHFRQKIWLSTQKYSQDNYLNVGDIVCFGQYNNTTIISFRTRKVKETSIAQ